MLFRVGKLAVLPIRLTLLGQPATGITPADLVGGFVRLNFANGEEILVALTAGVNWFEVGAGQPGLYHAVVPLTVFTPARRGPFQWSVLPDGGGPGSITGSQYWKDAALAATTGPLPSNTYSNGAAGVGATLTATVNGAFPTTDGVGIPLNSRLLVVAEAAGARNGIYVLTQVGDGSNPWILTRSSDCDDDTKILPTMIAGVQRGTLYHDTIWKMSSDGPIIVGTTTLTWDLFPSDDSNIVHKTGIETITGVKTFASGATPLVADMPTTALEVVNKAYADTIASGITPKPNARAISTVNVAVGSPPSGPATLDDIVMVTGDRACLNAQTDPVDNGIWIVDTAGAWTRPSDFDTGDHAAGSYVFATEGTLNAGLGFICTSVLLTDVIDTDPLTFALFTGLGNIVANNGLIRVGNQLDVVAFDGTIIVAPGSIKVGTIAASQVSGLPGDLTARKAILTMAINETTDSVTPTAVGEFTVDPAVIPSLFFQAIAAVTRPGLVGRVQLWNLTDSVMVVQLADFLSVTPTKIVSAILALVAGEKSYEVRYFLVNGSSPQDRIVLGWAGLRQ